LINKLAESSQNEMKIPTPEMIKNYTTDRKKAKPLLGLRINDQEYGQIMEESKDTKVMVPFPENLKSMLVKCEINSRHSYPEPVKIPLTWSLHPIDPRKKGTIKQEAP